MSKRWPKGAAVIEQLVEARSLERLQRGASDGSLQLDRARRTLAAARAVVTIDPDTAYANAYDAVRMAGTALLVHQGLRPTQSGGHRAVEEALRAQFSPGFQEFSTLRRRRHEIEYPSSTFSQTSEAEASEAVELAAGYIEKAGLLMEQIGLFW
ncbi:hypothetical protein [Luteococcus sp.]|uniref:hypothetical protein n=1 Tax=Luteococcus sp. TaxID=1969402 RepID=UPI003734FC13